MANTEENLNDYTDDYNRLRAQKARNVGSVELRILTNLSFVSGEHWIGSQNRTLFGQTHESLGRKARPTLPDMGNPVVDGRRGRGL